MTDAFKLGGPEATTFRGQRLENEVYRRSSGREQDQEEELWPQGIQGKENYPVNSRIYSMNEKE